jgi:hypothetical protein
MPRSASITSNTRHNDPNLIMFDAFVPGDVVLGYREGWPEVWNLRMNGFSVNLDLLTRKANLAVATYNTYNWHSVGNGVQISIEYFSPDGTNILGDGIVHFVNTSCSCHVAHTFDFPQFPDPTNLDSVRVSFVSGELDWRHNTDNNGLDDNSCQCGDNPYMNMIQNRPRVIYIGSTDQRDAKAESDARRTPPG